jgi:hypothetical protein
LLEFLSAQAALTVACARQNGQQRRLPDVVLLVGEVEESPKSSLPIESALHERRGA